MKYRPIPVKNVISGSIAEEAGIREGDLILSINGEKISDIFDYRFLIANEAILLEIQKKDGEVWEVEIEKDEYEDLGIEFEKLMLDDAKAAVISAFLFYRSIAQRNEERPFILRTMTLGCLFMGNYVTLTNMDFDDINRIIKYRMSQLIFRCIRPILN